MTLVIIESPYAGDVEKNLRYLRAALADCLSRGEAPYASHAIYTQPGVLRDEVPEERRRGIEAGFAWGEVAPKRAFYEDRGWSTGMAYGYAEAWRLNLERGQTIEIRRLPEWAGEDGA